jgi:hypothetical protein
MSEAARETLLRDLAVELEVADDAQHTPAFYREVARIVVGSDQLAAYVAAQRPTWCPWDCSHCHAECYDEDEEPCPDHAHLREDR